jgi:hypothetical protein
MLLIHQFDDRYEFAFGETRIRLPSSLVKVHHSLVRARARSRTVVRALEQTCGSGSDSPSPSCRRCTGADFE